MGKLPSQFPNGNTQAEVRILEATYEINLSDSEEEPQIPCKNEGPSPKKKKRRNRKKRRKLAEEEPVEKS
jgi:hypothetical protein